jgi:Arc/MetJ family transcription regulator
MRLSGVPPPLSADRARPSAPHATSFACFVIYVYKWVTIYTLEVSMRTNIEIDDDLLEEAMRATGQTTKRGTVEEALRQVVTTYRRRQAIADMAGLGWDGDLEAMRTGQPR